MIKYLYIDDESNETVQSYVDGLGDENLFIEYKHVDHVNSKDFFKTNLHNYDGVLLDLRTDELSKLSNFTGSVWGQHIRDLVTNNKIDTDIPIVLFSTDKKLRDTYFKDLTSNNIFDRFLTKDNTPDNATIKLNSLANGYKQIACEKDFNTLLQTDILNLDERIFSRFVGTDTSISVHEYAQMILKDLIYSKGVLVNEKYLASRLGIDIETSSDWEKLKVIFESTKYTGVFSDGWDRWWMYQVDDFFESIAGTYLSYLDAKEKVEIIREKLQVEKINYSKLIEENTSYNYWTVCKALKRPLDPQEGFRVYTRSEPKPWQEYEYISLYALLTKHPEIEKKNIKIHSMDKEKYVVKMKKYAR